MDAALLKREMRELLRAIDREFEFGEHGERGMHERLVEATSAEIAESIERLRHLLGGED